MPPKVREILALLKRDGWVKVGQKGSHRQFRHLVKPGRVTLNGHPCDDLQHDLHKSILRQAGFRK